MSGIPRIGDGTFTGPGTPFQASSKGHREHRKQSVSPIINGHSISITHNSNIPADFSRTHGNMIISRNAPGPSKTSSLTPSNIKRNSNGTAVPSINT